MEETKKISFDIVDFSYIWNIVILYFLFIIMFFWTSLEFVLSFSDITDIEVILIDLSL